MSDGRKSRLFGESSVIAMNIVLNLMHDTCRIGKAPPVPGRGSIGMKVGNKDVPARRADARHLSIGRERVWQVSQDQPAPHHIKAVRRKRHLPDIARRHVVGSSGGKHLRA
jgi:hypothetical protein